MKPYTWRSAIVNSELPSTTRHVLLTLSLYINDMGQSAYPSIERLSKETGLTDRAVGKHLRLAKELGWVRVGKMGFGGQNWANNCYFPQIPGDAEYTEQDIEGQERGSAPFQKGQERGSEGQERRSGEVRNHVPTNNPSEQSNEQSIRETRKKPRASSSPKGVIFDDWIAAVKAKGGKPIPEGHEVFKYAEKIDLPIDYVRLCWLEFKRNFGGNTEKKYDDWARTFSNYVRKNYFGLWYGKDEAWVLTTAGKQLQKEMRGEA